MSFIELKSYIFINPVLTLVVEIQLISLAEALDSSSSQCQSNRAGPVYNIFGLECCHNLHSPNYTPHTIFERMYFVDSRQRQSIFLSLANQQYKPLKNNFNITVIQRVDIVPKIG